MVIDIVQSALMAGVTAALGSVFGAVTPYVNELLDQVRPDSKKLRTIMPIIDSLLLERLDLTIGEIDLKEVAYRAIDIAASDFSIGPKVADRLAEKAVHLFDEYVFEQKRNRHDLAV